jgi:chemotaxis protein methyltransferase CheR
LEQLLEGHNHIWCAASSSGEEPYSVAIACLEKGFEPKIFATDISTHVLRLGQMGIYPMERAKHVSPQLLKKYFQKGHGKYENHIRVKDHVRQMVTFTRYNLLTDTPPSREFDVIFCRNVLIYFDNLVKPRVIERICSVLKPDGLFIIGGAESLNNIPHRLKYIRPSIYKKTR